MRKEKRLSVLMSVRNGVRFIGEAVSSILGQTYCDFDFVIVDDGSTDATPVWLASIAKTDQRIKVFQRTSSGLAGSLNFGLSKVNSEYVARMDADDISDPSRFERQIEFLDHNKNVVAVSSYLKYIDEDGDLIGKESSRPIEHASILEMLFRGEGALPHPAAMIRGQALRKIAGYDERFPAAQDLDLWLRLSEVGRLANLPLPLLSYRMHQQAVSVQRAQLQQECAQLAVAKAYERIGIEVAGGSARSRTTLVAGDSHDTVRKWIKMALQHNNYPTARKHAWRLLRAGSFRMEDLLLLRKCYFGG